MVLVAHRTFIGLSWINFPGFAAQEHFTQYENAKQKLVQENPVLLPKEINRRMAFIRHFYFWNYFTLDDGIRFFEIS